jgi:hypothetical protein
MLTSCLMTATLLLAQPVPADLPQRTPPIMRGTLWWMSYLPKASQEEYARCIQAQRDVGFDLLWLLNTPAMMEKARQNDAAGEPYDALDRVLQIADEAGMRVIVDLPQEGWYGKAEADQVIDHVAKHIQAFVSRYGKHPSLRGWYLNYEINPIADDNPNESAWWRKVWREETAACHRAIPNSLVTISPFFLMDEKRRRGFVYLAPMQYGNWWEETLRETKIDVLMLQDSGAEHLAFFTLADREPFFAAMQNACRRAGSHFWVNVESGEADVASWEEFIRKEGEKNVPWRFVPMDRLAAKIELASRYGESIVNWGYFPYMAPMPGEKETPLQREAYRAYQAYYQRQSKSATETLDLKK